MPSRPVTATTTPGPLASFNGRRRSMGVFNNGTDTCFIGQNVQNLLTQGIPLLAQQGLIFNRLDGDEPELDYFIVANSGSQNIRVFEGLGDPDKATGTAGNSV